MANMCTSGIPAGKQDCDRLLKRAKWVLISRPDVVYDTEADFVSLYNKVQNISVPNAKNELDSWLMEIYPPENTTDDATVVTLGNTRKIVTTNPIPSINFNAVTSFGGGQTILKSLSGNYKAEFFGDDMILLGTYNPELLKYSGFDCNITATTKGIPVEADPEKMVMIYMNFSNVEQFMYSEAKALEWNAGVELMSNEPSGLKLKALTKYTAAGGAIEVQINDSYGDGKEDLVTADFVELRSNNLTDIAITATEDALKGGKYSLAITKDAIPVNLAAGDTLVFQTQVKNGSIPIALISNEYVINVLS